MFKPILFNTEMVQAIKAGRKTQTRRLVKEIPLHAPYFELCDGEPFACDMYGDWHPAERFCRIQPGDILWVRETWCKGRIEYGEEPDGRNVPYIGQCTGDDRIIHKEWALRNDIGLEDVVWKPSIHMPKAAARIFLRVKDVRVERLQEITVLDAINEGCSGTICDHADAHPTLGCTDCYNTGWLEAPDAEFAQLWDTTIKPSALDKHGWNANPWVWVIEFEQIEKPEDWK